MNHARNCLSYWFPLVRDAGLPVPETRIVTTDAPLVAWITGEASHTQLDSVDWLLADLLAAGDALGYPCFLRTGQGSGKHEWSHTCYWEARDEINSHVARLVEWSELVDVFGLPSNVWVIRRLIPTTPLFTAFDGMPITREFRYFIRDGEIEHRQPYWPPGAFEDGRLVADGPNKANWEPLLDGASRLGDEERATLDALALRTSAAVPGNWSVDFLQAADGSWWLTDMATGDDSFWWDPATGEDNRR